MYYAIYEHGYGLTGEIGNTLREINEISKAAMTKTRHIKLYSNEIKYKRGDSYIIQITDRLYQQIKRCGGNVDTVLRYENHNDILDIYLIETKKCTLCEKTKSIHSFIIKDEMMHTRYDMCQVCQHQIVSDIKRKEHKQHWANKLSSAVKLDTCSILKKHHSDLSDDPERLSTKFINELIGSDCK